MIRTFEQGWAARPFKEQFPELSNESAEYLDKLNESITRLYLGGMLTDSQMTAMRNKKMPQAVSKQLQKCAQESNQQEGE